MNLRAALGCAVLAVGAGAAMAVPAWDDANRARSEPLAMELGTAAGNHWALPYESSPPPSARLRAPALDGPGPVQLRWGVDLHRRADDAVQPFVGLGLATGRRTTLYVEQGLRDDPATLPSPSSPAADTRLGLEFRTGSKDSALREFGTLRMQIGMHSRLSLKPRRGGATITWHTRF